MGRSCFVSSLLILLSYTVQATQADKPAPFDDDPALLLRPRYIPHRQANYNRTVLAPQTPSLYFSRTPSPLTTLTTLETTATEPENRASPTALVVDVNPAEAQNQLDQNQPVGDEWLPTTASDAFYDSPSVAADRTSDDVRNICNTDAMALTQKNWLASGALELLQNVTAEGMLEQRDGSGNRLLQQIASTYLGNGDFVCGAGALTTCTVSCSQVVTFVDDLETARDVYFLLKQAEHLNVIFNESLMLLTTAQVNIDGMVERMTNDLFWSEPTYYQQMSEELTWYFEKLVEVLVASSGVWLDASSILSIMGDMQTSARHKRDGYRADLDRLRQSSHPAPDAVHDLQNKFERAQQSLEAATRRMSSMSEINRIYKKMSDNKWYGAFAAPFLAYLAPTAMFGTMQDQFTIEDDDAGDSGELAYANQRACTRAREGLRNYMSCLFSGCDADTDGTSSFMKLVAGGGYLNSNDISTAFWRSADAEKAVTRGVMMRAVDASLKSQPIWISCTSEFLTNDPRRNSYRDATIPTGLCSQDRSGPGELKACIGGMVCYMYKWNDRVQQWRHRVERPYAWEMLPEDPYGFRIPDIISSSVRTHLVMRDQPGGIDAGPHRWGTAEAGMGPDALWSPQAAGAFSVPVCISTHNWETSVEPVFSLTCDMNPWCHKKRLPCNCGPWGNETEYVMRTARLWDNGYINEYRGRRCPLQIDQIIDDKFDRWVARCRIDKNPNALCGPVIEALQEMGNPSRYEMSASFEIQLMCMAGILSSRKCSNTPPYVPPRA